MTEEKAVRPKPKTKRTVLRGIRTIKPEHYELCVKIAGGMKPSDAAKEMGWHPKTAFAIMKRKEVAECLAKLTAGVTAKLLKRGTAETVKQFTVTRSDVFKRMSEIMNTPADQTNGTYTAQVKAAEVLAKILGMIVERRSDDTKDFANRTPEELEFFAAHGYWPNIVDAGQSSPN